MCALTARFRLDLRYLTACYPARRATTFSAAHNNMQTSRTGTSFRPEEAYATAAAQFFELMKTFGMGVGPGTDWKSLAAPLAAQFERWLQASQTMTPWFAAATPGAFGGAGLAAPAAAAFGPLPFGPAAVSGAQPARTLELLGRRRCGEPGSPERSGRRGGEPRSHCL